MAEAPEDKQAPIVRTVTRLLKLFGVTFPKDIPIPKPIDKGTINDFTYRELRHIAGFDKDYRSDSVNSGMIDEYVRSTAQQSKAWVREAKNLKILTPEIDNARDIVVSTILSPTDLQSDKVGITVSNTGLGEELEGEISAELQKFYNEKFKLGEKASLWIGDALFADGATAVLVLPEKNINLVNTAIDIDERKAGIDPNDHIIQKPNNTKIGGRATHSSEDLLGSFEAIIANYKDATLDNLLESVCDDYITTVASVEAFQPDHLIKTRQTVKDTASEIATLINNNDKCIMFSSDPTMLKTTESRLHSEIDVLTKQIENNFLFNNNTPTFLVTDKSTGSVAELATTMRVPYHAVIPVTVPNAPESHIGYFIVVDEWGSPINEDYYDATSSGGGKKMSEAGMQAVFGKPTMSALSNLNTESNEFESASTIFGLMLRHMMDDKIKGYGLAGASIGYREAVSSCIFRQLIHKKRVGLIFVPEPLMLYLCYDYNDNGTGKSKIQETSMLISLRNTLLISGVMAATENSIDKKKIEVAVDEKNVNIEQTLNMVRNAFIEKNMLRFDNNPHTIQRDLVQKSMTIYPKGIKGVPDALNVSIDRAQAGSIEPNDNLVEKLTNWIIMTLIAPAAAMNKTGDEEYSRSVATTNLFFNNRIRGLQSKTIEHLSKFIQLHAKYSGVVYEKIADIIRDSIDKHDIKRTVEVRSTEAEDFELSDTDTTEEREHTIIAPVVKESTKTNTKTVSDNVATVIRNLQIKLPAPRIVVDKAHYEEIQGYINTLDTILQAIYSDDMTMGMEGYAQPLSMLRAMIKEDMLRDYVKTIGFQSSYNLPPLSEIATNSKLDEILLHLINVQKGAIDIDKHIKKQVIKEEDQSTFGGGGGGYDQGGGFGDDSMSMGGDFGAPGGEDQLGSEPQGQEEDTTEQEQPNQQDGTTKTPSGDLT